MNTYLIAVGIAAVMARVPADAKTKNTSFEGCVEQRQGNYELATSTAKGKVRHYKLAGDHNFAADVGHKVRVNGASAKVASNVKRTIDVGSVQTLADKCR